MFTTLKKKSIMKTFSKQFVLLTLMILVFSQCKKDDTVYQAYFYSLESPDEAKLFLFIDEESKGELPFVQHGAGVTTDSIKKYALKLQISAGKYQLETKDQNGQIRSSGKIRVSKNKLSSSGGIGGQEIIMENNELRVGFSF